MNLFFGGGRLSTKGAERIPKGIRDSRCQNLEESWHQKGALVAMGFFLHQQLKPMIAVAPLLIGLKQVMQTQVQTL